jgi:hypothetical protein
MKDGLALVLKMPRTISATDARLRINAALKYPAAYSELKAHIKGKPAKDAKRIDTPEAMQAALEVLNGAISRARKNTPVLVITDLMVCRFNSLYSLYNLCDCSLILGTSLAQVSKQKQTANVLPADSVVQARLDGSQANLLRLRQKLRCDTHSVQGDIFCLV